MLVKNLNDSEKANLSMAEIISLLEALMNAPLTNLIEPLKVLIYSWEGTFTFLISHNTFEPK